jgi:hypothetical protein
MTWPASFLKAERSGLWCVTNCLRLFGQIKATKEPQSSQIFYDPEIINLTINPDKIPLPMAKSSWSFLGPPSSTSNGSCVDSQTALKRLKMEMMLDLALIGVPKTNPVSRTLHFGCVENAYTVSHVTQPHWYCVGAWCLVRGPLHLHCSNGKKLTLFNCT